MTMQGCGAIFVPQRLVSTIRFVLGIAGKARPERDPHGRRGGDTGRGQPRQCPCTRSVAPAALATHSSEGGEAIAQRSRFPRRAHSCSEGSGGRARSHNPALAGGERSLRLHFAKALRMVGQPPLHAIAEAVQLAIRVSGEQFARQVVRCRGGHGST